MPRPSALACLLCALTAAQGSGVAQPAGASRLRVSRNGRYLEDASGPFFLVGDCPQNLPLKLPVGEIDGYMAECESRGFNWLWICIDGQSSGGPPTRSPADRQGQRMMVADWDIGTLNERYFETIDAIVRAAERHHEQCALTPLSECQWSQADIDRNPVESWGKYGRFLGKRYRDRPNIVWVIGNDNINKRAQHAIVEGIKAAGDTHLVTVNWRPGYHQEGSGWVRKHEHGESWIDLNAWYLNAPIRENGAPCWWQKIEYERPDPMPSFQCEAAYQQPDGARASDLACRMQNHYVALGGGCGGQVYGAGWLADAWDYDTYRQNGGRLQAIHFKRLFTSRDWTSLVPDYRHAFITAGYGTLAPSTMDYVGVAMNGGTLGMAYCPKSAVITADLSRFSGPVTARWHDPTNGELRGIPGSPFPHTGSRSFTTPGVNAGGDEDWVLVLEAAAAIAGPLRQSRNPRYFEDASGAPLVLCGSQTWNTLQDWGTGGAVQALDFDAFVGFLKEHGHNFTLLWCTELPRFRALPTTEASPPDFTVSPFPWKRTGPGAATDGGLRFDLAQLEPEFFGRLRARVEALDRAGIYAGVYLFSAEFLLRFRCSTDGYPFTGANNVNGIDDGYTGGSTESAVASVTMTAPNAITELQDAYVRKTIDTLSDLPNVLWIVSEEAPPGSTWWNAHLISLVRAYETTKGHPHPIGYAALDSAPDSIIYDSDADWVAPGTRVSPVPSCGSGRPRCKVNINDSDHSYFGMWNDTPQVNRNYAWENLLAGSQVLFMDPYVVHYPRQGRNLCESPAGGICSKPDARWEGFRRNLGYLLRYSRKLSLANVTPSGALCSTGHCLAQTPPAGAEYLAYAPSGGAFTMDLSAMPATRRLAVEWFNPASGETVIQEPVSAGPASRPFQAPFEEDAVLYLVDVEGHR